MPLASRTSKLAGHQLGVGRERHPLGQRRRIDDHLAKSDDLAAPVRVATRRLSWIRATSFSSPMPAGLGAELVGEIAHVLEDGEIRRQSCWQRRAAGIIGIAAPKRAGRNPQSMERASLAGG